MSGCGRHPEGRPDPASRTTDAIDTFPHKTGISMYASFCDGRETYSTGVMAISIPCTDPAYGTVCSVGVYNSPWQGDHFNHEAAEADYASFSREHRAVYDAMPGNVDEAKQNALSGMSPGRIYFTFITKGIPPIRRPTFRHVYELRSAS